MRVRRTRVEGRASLLMIFALWLFQEEVCSVCCSGKGGPYRER